MSKVVVGMSGGVDSAVTAYLLKASGYDVIGVTLRTWRNSAGKESRCCEIDDAQKTAWMLDIPYYAVNYETEFNRYVTGPFVEEYIRGNTPNPCIGCNRHVKWEGLLGTADFHGAEYVATGHYASVIRLDNGRYTVKEAAFAGKDQTYMLYMLTQEQLARTLMPLGGLDKSEVRRIAASAGLEVANKPDSQEICFVPDGDYSDFILEERHGDVPGPGNFVSVDGEVLGRHKGIINYTVGQRRGLGLALGYHVYVKELRPETNEVVLAENEELFTDKVLVKDTNFMAIDDLKPGERRRVKARIRYNHKGGEAEIMRTGENEVTISFDAPVRAAAPGQGAVFYENGYILGGGTITRG